jgi:hypothetical protein
MEDMVSKAAALKVIQDQIEYYTNQLDKQATELMYMEQRFKDNAGTLDGLILYKRDYNIRRDRMTTVLSELLDVKGALERL